MSCETELDFDAVFAPSLLDLWKAHRASFFFVFVFSFAFCESCTITGFEQIQTAYVNLLKVLGWTTDLSALHTKLLVSVSAVYAFVLFWSGMNLKFLPYGKTLVTFSQAQLFVMLDYTS